MDPIGKIAILRRYPVKSMQGEDVTSAQVTFAGLAGDRVWAFVQASKAAADDDFPWHSAREQHDMLLYHPRFRAPATSDQKVWPAGAGAVEVTTPGGRTLAVDDPELLAELSAKVGYSLHLRYSERSMVDSRPVSIFGLATVKGLTDEVGYPVDHRRFRANLYVEWNDPTPFFEDSLVGRRLGVGKDVELLIVKKDPRCIIINLEPATGTHRPEVLKTVARRHAGCCGVYAAVLRGGRIDAGSPIALKEP
jgi:uncharacterized protein YcbX